MIRKTNVHLKHSFICLKLILIGLILLISNNQTLGQVTTDINSLLDQNNVSWNVPGPTSAQSMPIGNGDIGLNVWVETNGDLVFYISKTDSWSEDNYGSWGLLKLGKVRVTLSPAPTMTTFLQVLKLRTGEILITENNTTFRVWVDANNPVIRVESSSDQSNTMTVTLENWRTSTQNGVTADVISSTETSNISWYHRNLTSNINLKTIFGAIIKGTDLVNKSSTVLESSVPSTSHLISIFPLTEKNVTPGQWANKLKDNINQIEGLDFETTRTVHQNWWNEFWHRSWVFVRGDAAATNITKGYVLQRFVTACGGRGAYPIKFNGSIFVVDNPALDNGNGTTISVNADYRTWGGQYWFQNTRAMYWPRLAAGDFDLMRPLFDMYAKILPANAAQVKTYYNHEGSYFAETAPFFGGIPYAGPEVTEDWTLHYFTPILELSMMMLDYYEFTEDSAFAKQTLLPVAKSGITFFDKHFPRDTNGKMLLDPDNSIEMFWKVKNPAPDIAGLRAVLARLIALPETLVDNTTRLAWVNLLAQIPELPNGLNGDIKVLFPYEGPQTAQVRNRENPELYSVYPFRIYGYGKPDLQLAINTFNARKQTSRDCWSQDPVQAAMLGLSNIAKDYVSFNLTRKDPRQKFPAFWEKVNDYSPDEDNGGNGEHGLQLMIMQTEGKKITLLPAWPQGWEGDFKLNAPFQTTVQGTISNGTVTNLIVTPAERAADVTILSSIKISQTGWIANASNNNGEASKAIDGKSATRWNTQTLQVPGQTFTLKFAKKEKLNKVILDYQLASGDGPESFELLVSDNGNDWYGPVLSGKGSNIATEMNFQSVTSQYLRIIQTGSKNLYWSIAELNAFGDAAAVSVTGITIEADNVAVPVNSKLQLNAVIIPVDAQNKAVVWQSSDPKIATVNENGVLTGLAVGETTITAITLDGIYKTTKNIKVTDETDIKTVKNSFYEIEITPNPARDYILVKTPFENYTLKITDSKGQLIITVQGINSKSIISTKNMKKGLYLVSVIHDNQQVSEKLIIV